MMTKRRAWKQLLAATLAFAMVFTSGAFGQFGSMTAKANKPTNLIKMSTFVSWRTEWDENGPRLKEGPVIGDTENEASTTYFSTQELLAWNTKQVAFSVFDGGDSRKALSSNTVLQMYQADNEWAYDKDDLIPDPSDDKDTRLECPAGELEELSYTSDTDSFALIYMAQPGRYVIKSANKEEAAEDGQEVNLEVYEPVAGFTNDKSEFSQDTYIQNWDWAYITEDHPLYFMYDLNYITGINSTSILYSCWDEDLQEDLKQKTSIHGIKKKDITEGVAEGYGCTMFYVDSDTDQGDFNESIKFILNTKANTTVPGPQFWEYSVNTQRRQDQFFGFRWADVDWKNDNPVDMRYQTGGDYDGFGSDTGMDSWSDHTVALATLDLEGKKTPYTGEIQVTKARLDKKTDQWIDTGVAVDADDFEISLIGADDPRMKVVPDEFKDAAYYDMRFNVEGDFCLTATDMENGNNKLFIQSVHPMAAFYRTNEISGESFVQDWSDRLDVNKGEGFYFIIDDSLDDNREFTFNGFAVWDDKAGEDHKGADVPVSDKDFAKVYPWLTYYDIVDDEHPDWTVIYITGNGNQSREEYNDVKLWISEKNKADNWTDFRSRGINVRYTLKDLSVRLPWENSAVKKVGCWVMDGTADLNFLVDGENYDGNLIVKFEGNSQSDTFTENLTVHEGRVRFTLDKIGTYRFKTSEDSNDEVVIISEPKPIDCFGSMDLADRAGNTMFAKKGEGKKVYVYLNKDLTEEKDGLEAPYTFKRMDVGGYLDLDGDSGNNEVMLDITELTAEDANGYWYSIELPATYKIEGKNYKFDNYNIHLVAEAVGTGRMEEKWLNVKAIEDGRKQILIGDGQYDNTYTGQITDNVNMVIYPFGAYLNFKPVSMKLQADGTFTPVPVAKNDLSNLRIGYWKETDDLDDENNPIWVFTEGSGVTFDVNEDGSVTAVITQEGRFEIRYGAEGEGEYVAELFIHQPDLDIYTNETKPLPYEDVNLLTDDVTVYEKKGVENGTFYIFWRAWDKAAQEKFETETEKTGRMTADYAAELLQDENFGFDKNHKYVGNHLDNYFGCLDPDSFDPMIVTASEKEIRGKDVASWITVTDVKDGDFVVGKKIVVSKDVDESFRLQIRMKRGGFDVYERLCVRNDEGYIVWDEALNRVKLQEDIVLNGSAIGMLGDMMWTADPDQVPKVYYDVTFVPFTSLKLDKAPTKTSYTEGDSLDLAGLAVSGVYDNGQSVSLAAADYSVNLSGALKTTDTKVVVTYKNNPDLKCEFTITVAKKADQKTDDKKDDQKETQKEEPKADPKPQPETPAPAKVGETIKNSAAPTGTDSTFKVTQAATGASNGKVAYTGEGANSAATAMTVGGTITGADGNKYDVTEVADGALKDNATIKKLTFADTVETVGADACKGMKALESVTLGKNVTTVKKNSFANDKKLKSFKGGAALTSIEAGAFSGDAALRTLDLSKSQIKTLGKDFLKDARPKTIKVNVNNLKKVGKKLTGFTAKNKIVLYAKNQKIYKAAVKKFKSAGAKKAKYSMKKAKK